MNFDPNENPKSIENYLNKNLGYQAEFVQATRLAKSTREAPWKLIVETNRKAASYVLQLDQGTIEHEYQALKAMEQIPISTPKVYGLDLSGKEIGVPCFFSDFIEGESLLEPMIAGELWAEELYLNTVGELQSVTTNQLGNFAKMLEYETAKDVLEDAYSDLKTETRSLADVAYRKLKRTMPKMPAVRFSNGDLWLENFIAKDQKLAGVIDFANATFSDPIFEFLLSFFVAPELQGRGIEERYCQQMGYDPSIICWYHGLEYFDTWRWVLKTGEGFVHHTAKSLENDLRNWLGDE
jgi:aminoglycoside phosphotransferase (APT) family kinase protein